MSPWAIMNALVHSRHELGKIPGLENLPVRTATHLKTVTPPAGSRPRFRKHCVSIPSSHDGLVGFNSVLAVHLLGVDAGSVSPARIGGLEELITSAPTRLRTENVMKAAA